MQHVPTGANREMPTLLNHNAMGKISNHYTQYMKIMANNSLSNKKKRTFASGNRMLNNGRLAD